MFPRFAATDFGARELSSETKEGVKKLTLNSLNR